MNSRLLCRWFVAIVMIVGVAAGGLLPPDQPAAAEARPGSGIATTMSTLSGPEGVMPVKAQAGPAAAHERGVRIKLPLPVTALFALALIVAMIRQALRRRNGRPAPLAERSRSLPRRAPPLLSLG